MNDHQLSKITTGMVKAPINPTDGTVSTLHDKDRPHHQSTMQDLYNDDSLHVHQPEPRGFSKVTDSERNPGMDLFHTERDDLTRQFYQKIQDLKNEQRKTLEMINRLNSEADTRRYQAKNYPDNSRMKDSVFDRTKYQSQSEGVFLTENNSDEEKHDEVKDESSDEENLLQPRQRVTISESQHSRREKVRHMWDDFDLREYVRPAESIATVEDVKEPRPKSAPIKKKVWSPVITIPKPFSMTIREESKKAKTHTRSSEAVAKEARERLEQEELEIQTRIRPREPPAHTFLPLFEEITERQEQRSRMNREHAERTLRAMVKPFSFTEREEAKRREKEKLQTTEKKKQRKAIKSMSQFVARPVPPSVHDPTIADKMKEEELYRQIKKKLRSEDMMRSSALPPRMQSHEMIYAERKKKKQKDLKKRTKPSFRPETHDMPNFEALHRRDDMEKFARKTCVQTTMTEPFELRTASLKKKKEAQTLARRKVDEEEQNYRNSVKSLRSSKQYTGVASDTIPTRMTESARLRYEETKRAIAQAEHELVELKLKERARKERRKQMAQEVAARTMASDVEVVTPSDYRREKLKQYQTQQRARDSEYHKELKEMNNRLKQRPLLFEMQAQKSARDKAEKRYKEILRNSGLSDDMFDDVASPSPGRRTQTIDDYSDDDFENSLDKSGMPAHKSVTFEDSGSEMEERIDATDDGDDSRSSVKKQLDFDAQ